MAKAMASDGVVAFDALRLLTGGGSRRIAAQMAGTSNPVLDRLWAARTIFGLSAAGLLVLAALDLIGWWQAIAGLGTIAAVAALVPGRTSGPQPPAGPPTAVEPRLGAVLAALPNPVIVLDNELEILAFNPAAKDLVPALRVGEALTFAIRVPELLEAVREVAQGNGAQRVDYQERVPTDRAIEAQVSTISEGDGTSARLLLVLRDVTQAVQLERMRADFVANASHELRTPLASVLGFIETLQGPARNDTLARERFLAIMRDQANRMSRLIDDLLSLSRIELNANIRPRDVVDLVNVVGHVVDTLGPLASSRDVAIDVASFAPSVRVVGDRDELIRVFENLVENAIKYGGSGKRVDVAVQAAGETDVTVSVRDFGPGIDSEHIPRLTERFYRVDTAQSREKGGTGLGLAIVKHILVRHRGRLLIESRKGDGALFQVRLARIVEDTPPDRDTAAPRS